MPRMFYSKQGLAFTESFESCKLIAYQDQGGVWTIAWGHTRGVGKGLTCIQEQADQWAWEDIGFAEAAVNDLVVVNLSQAEFDALVDFAFNVGNAAFAGSSMRKLLNEGDYTAAADEFAKWDHVKGVEVAGLLRRRLNELLEFEGKNVTLDNGAGSAKG